MPNLSQPDLEALKTALAESEGSTWHALSFGTVSEAVDFVNLPPAQRAGEFVFSNNSEYNWVDVAYFL